MLITSGLLNKQAGAELGLTEKTIKVHRARVMHKMAAGSLAELAKIAHRLGMASQALLRPPISNDSQQS
jgi:DNA-binding NarL/FixJ family response regulator